MALDSMSLCDMNLGSMINGYEFDCWWGTIVKWGSGNGPVISLGFSV